MPTRKRPGGALIYTVFALALIAFLMLAALMSGATQETIVYNQLRHRQLTTLSESAMTYGLWKLEKDGMAAFPAAENVSDGGEQSFTVALDAIEKRVHQYQLKGTAFIQDDRKVLYARVLMLEKPFLLADENPFIVSLPEREQVSIATLTLPVEDHVLLYGVGGKEVTFDTGGAEEPYHLSGDFHFCAEEGSFGTMIVTAPVQIDGTLIVDGDVVLESELQAQMVIILGELQLTENGSLIAEDIFLVENPGEEMAEKIEGNIETLPEHTPMVRRVYVLSMEDKGIIK